MLEYAMVIAVVAGAVILMRDLVKRSVQGHFRGVAVKISEDRRSPFNDLKLYPNHMDKYHSGVRDHDLDFSSGKGRDIDYAYSPGATQSSITKRTEIAEDAQSDGQNVKTRNLTSKITSGVEYIAARSQEPSR
jgi:hypothetical protein